VINWNTPTITYNDELGYTYVETSERWKQQCEQLPCFDALRWPLYESTHIEARINGQPVVIQLWAGYCEKFLGMQNFPGGVGAEVGVYRRQPRRPRPRALPPLPFGWEHRTRDAIDQLPDDALWWPAPGLNAELEFEFVNTDLNLTLFAAGPERSYWLAKWMNEQSYGRFARAAGSLNGFLPDRYTLRYKINGQTRTWVVPTWTPAITVRNRLGQILRDIRSGIPVTIRR
jgi:hypothetical protein